VIVVVLLWAAAFFWDARLAEGRADRAEAQRDELRSRIEHAAPLWRRDDRDFPGARW
jgi:hypothetical protein